jgi:hypothetical protein
MGSPPTHDFQAAYIHSMSKPFHLMPHISQNSPSRFGHQSVQRYAHGRPPQGSDWNQIKIQAPSGFSNVGPRSPRNASFTGNMSWGIYYLPHCFIHPLCFLFFLFCYFVFILLLHWKFHWYYSQALGITSVPPSFSFFLIPVPWLVGPTWLFRALASGFHCRVGSITDLI